MKSNAKIKRYSLINVFEEHKDGTVSGFWVQNKTGTLQEAKEWAKETEKANSNRITVAVVAEIPFGAELDIIRAKKL